MPKTDWLAEELAWINSGDDSTFQEWCDRPKPKPLTPHEQRAFQALANAAWSQQMRAQNRYSNGTLSGLGGALGGLL